MIAVSRRRWLGLVAAGLVGGCLSPTLPLPPPSPPDTVLATEEQGIYRLQGRVSPNTYVTAYNLDRGLSFGQEVHGDGRYDFLVRGEEGDAMELKYVEGNDESLPISFTLKPTP